MPRLFRKSSSDNLLSGEMGPGGQDLDDSWFKEKDYRDENVDVSKSMPLLGKNMNNASVEP